MSSQICAIENCKRASRTLCHCCKQNLCRDHFNEHDDLLNAQLNPLTDGLNALADRITAINIDKIVTDGHHKLNQWRFDCHKIIDQFYEKKCQELDRYVNESIDKQRKKLFDLRSKMTELIEKQETTRNDIDSLTSAIHSLEQKMNVIEHIQLQIDIDPLVLDDKSIQIGRTNTYQFNLLKLPPIYKKIERPAGSRNLLASNDRCLLVHIHPNLCLLNEDLSFTKQKTWDSENIYDMCWSSALERFVITTEKGVVLVDEHSMSIERVQQIQKMKFWVCGCSNKSLYLSRGVWDSSLLEFSLLPFIQFVKLWKTNDTVERKQRVDVIVHNRETLALAINDQSIEAKLVQLRSLETFSLLWSVQLDLVYNNTMVHCCLLKEDEWLIADWYSSCLFHITNEGKIEGTDKYTSTPNRTNLFNSNILVILTDGCINFHKL